MMKTASFATFLAFAASSSSLCSAYERKLSDERRLGMGKYSETASSKFVKYLDIYDRCCDQTPETLHSEDSPCKCPVRTVSWFGIYDKWNSKCDSRIQPKSSIAALAASNEDFSTLLSLVGQYDDLVEALTGPGSLTVFAPTNAAFEAMLATIPADNPLTADEIRSVLTYHVVATAAVPSTELTNGQVVTTQSGETITIDKDINGAVSIKDGTDDLANVNPADLLASNGIVHVIDKVLVPPNFRSESISQ